MSAQARHTPGPWKVAKHYGLTRTVYAADPDDGIIATIFPSDLGNGEWSQQTDADARLIAAAPELLAALQTIVRQYDAERHPLQMDWQAARAAIAKATGNA